MKTPENLITSTQNPRVKELVALRKERGTLALVEGAREIEAALQARALIRSVWLCPARLSEPERALLPQLSAACPEPTEVAPHVFEKIAYREHPGGLLVVVQPQRRALSQLALSQRPLLLLVEGVEKPGNAGAMLRTADAAGVDAVLFCDCPLDLYNPNLIRASLGTVFTLPAVATTGEEACAFLARQGIRPILAAPQAERDYFDADLSGPCAIVVGSESAGLSRTWEKLNALRVRIPMQGSSDSLNVSVAAAILLFEALRQRREN
ncbi:RNA methyltransferase [bacterium]|nr:RNA methyltransferase [bacterium]